MGKGSRNRAKQVQAPVVSSTKKQPKQAPQWILPLVIILLVIAILAIPITMAITGSGLIERSRILIKSKTGKFDVSQPMATYMAWQILLDYSASSIWDTVKSQKVPNQNITFQQYYTELYGANVDHAVYFAVDNAGGVIQDDTRGSIEPYMEEYKEYVAVCDAAYEAGVTISEAGLANVNTAIEELKTLYPTGSYKSLDDFLHAKVDKGVKEKDVRAALEMKTLHDEYKATMQKGFQNQLNENGKEQMLEDYREAHPENYYKTDYLTIQTPSKELAEKLMSAKNAKEFKEIIIQNHFDTNYSATFATYLSQVEYEAIGGATDSDVGTALTDALNTLNFPEKKTYAEADIPDEALKKWLFTSGAVGTATQISTTDGIYIAALLAKNTDAGTVDARWKFYNFSDSHDSYNGDTAFKTSSLNVMFAEKYAELLSSELRVTDADIEQILDENNAKDLDGITRDSDIPHAIYRQVFELGNKKGSICTGFGNGVYYVIYIRDCESVGSGEAFHVTKADISYCAFGAGVANYLSGTEKQMNLLSQLDAEGANKEAIMRSYNPFEKTNITNKSNTNEIPSAVKNALFKDFTNVALGDVLSANANGVYYVIYVTGLGNDGVSASVLYVEFKSDFFYRVTDSLIAGLDSNKVYPEVKSTLSYTPTAAAGTFAAWLSETKPGTMESARYEFETNMFPGTDDNGNAVYNAYIIINKPLYIDEYNVVDGAYLRVTDDANNKGSFIKKAAEIEQKLLNAKAAGTVGEDLIALLKTYNAQVDIFSKNAIPNDELADWMFDEEREPNDIKSFTVEGSSYIYIGIYLDSYPSWYAKAEEDYINSKTDEWLAGLTESYTINQKALDRIGDPTTATTVATTTAKEQ